MRTSNKTVNTVDTEAPATAPADKAPFPFLDLKAQFGTIRDEVMRAIAAVMEDQRFILGPEVESFEQEMATYLGVRAAVSCASGSDALLLALLALGIGPGDEVITTPFSFVATASAAARVGAKPVFVDIEEETFNLDPRLIEPAVTGRTRAVLPVHLFGLSADLQAILKVAARHKMAVIEDAAQAIGAQYNGRAVGTLGEFGCLSFYPSKNLGGAGDGGMVVTNDLQLADRLRMLRVHGSRKKYHYEALGTNSRLDTLQAAILRVKLPHLDGWARKRAQKADLYRQMFADKGLDKRIQLPSPPPHCVHVYNQFVIRCAERDRLRDFLQQRGIPTDIYYPVPLHLQPAFAYLGDQPGKFPRAEAASREVLALPIFPELTEEQQAAVVRAISEFYRHAA